jgi:ribosome-binding protein aMBF1 (putative translation factor)
MKSYSLDEAENLLIGQKGSKEREEYESELKLELIGDMIRTVRKERKLTQEQLAEILGVKKHQISGLESCTGSETFESGMLIFKDLQSEFDLNFNYLEEE